MKNDKPPTRVIACGVFRPALARLRFAERHPEAAVSFLPSRLHLHPGLLEEKLAAEIDAALDKGEQVLCLYGECFPGIDEFCSRSEAVRISGLHCYEILLGGGAYRRIVAEDSGTFFMEQELILNFDEYCAGPLELDDAEMRAAQFGHYRRLLYIRQPADPDVGGRLSRISDLLGLPCEIRDADYVQLETRLDELMNPECKE